MLVTLMKSKIHNATITHADLHYEGSITIDQELMELARIFKGERVQIVNLNNGERLETYVIVGERGSGVVGINGPAALKISGEPKLRCRSKASIAHRAHPQRITSLS